MAYRVIGVQYDNKFNICGFKIQNVIQIKTVDIDKLEELINNGDILGVDIIKDDKNIKHLVLQDENLSELQMVYPDDSYKKDELTAIAILIQNNEPYGYRFKVGDQFKNYSLQVTWELARRGCISNIKASFEEGTKVICGKNSTNTWELPTIIKE